MSDFSTFWNYANKAGSVLLSTGALTYLVKEAKKRFVKPELACTLTINTCLTPCNNNPVSDGRGGWLHVSEADYGIEQRCTLNITNLSEHMALRVKILKTVAFKKTVGWKPEPDYTAAIAGFQRLTQDIIVEMKYAGDFKETMAFKSSKAAMTNEIHFEYQNAFGRKFILIFKPNETDVNKRNVCVKA